MNFRAISVLFGLLGVAASSCSSPTNKATAPTRFCHSLSSSTGTSIHECQVTERDCNKIRGQALASGAGFKAGECAKAQTLFCASGDRVYCGPSQAACYETVGALRAVGAKVGECEPATSDDLLRLDQQGTLFAQASSTGSTTASVGTSGVSPNKAKTAEARQFVKKLYDGSRVYYMDNNGRATFASNATHPQFPGPAVGPTPPLGECCANGGKCDPKGEQWDHPVWIALQFSVDDPHYYSYSYEPIGECAHGASCSFYVRAQGDLDCDGIYSMFSMYGEINDQYSDGPAGTAAVYRENPLE